MSAKSGAGGPYSKKYVKVTQDELRNVIIPTAADYCARQRAIQGWTPAQYRSCLKSSIRKLIRGQALE